MTCDKVRENSQVDQSHRPHSLTRSSTRCMSPCQQAIARKPAAIGEKVVTHSCVQLSCDRTAKFFSLRRVSLGDGAASELDQTITTAAYTAAATTTTATAAYTTATATATTIERFCSTSSWRRNRTNVASEARPRFSTLSWYVNHVNSGLATVSRRSWFCSHLRRFVVRHDSHLFDLGTRGWEGHAFLCLEEGAKPHPGFSAFTSSQSAAKCCKTKTWRGGWRQITYVFWHVITYCKTSLRPCAFFSMFLVTRPRSFWLKTKKKKKKKKKKNWCSQNQSCWASVSCAQHLHVALADSIDWTSQFLHSLRGGGRRTFSFSVVWVR